MTRTTRRDYLLAIALYTVLIAAFYAPVVLNGKTLQPSMYQGHGIVQDMAYGYEGRLPASTFNIDLATPAYYEWPVNRLVGETYTAGELPLWNPYQGAGTPLAAQYSSRVFFPYQVIEDLSPVWSWDFFILGRLLVAGFFTFVFLSLSGSAFIAAFTAGALYMFSGSFTWFINLEQFSNNAMMIPVLLCSLDRMARVGGRRWTGLTALAVAMVVLAGQPEVGLYTMLLGACYYAFMLVTASRPGLLWPSVYKFLCAVLLGVLMAAPLVIPFAEYTRNAHHIHPPGGKMGVQDPSPAYIATGILSPTYLESTAEPGEMTHATGPAEDPLYFRYFPHNGRWDWLGGYTGLVCLVLAAAASLMSSAGMARRRRRYVLFFSGFGLFIVFKNFGVMPFELLGYLPLFDQVWSPRWAGPSWTFAAAAAAGFAVQVFADSRVRGRGEAGTDLQARRTHEVEPALQLRKRIERLNDSFGGYVNYPLLYALSAWGALSLSYNSYKRWLDLAWGLHLDTPEKAMIKGSFVWGILTFAFIYIVISAAYKKFGLERLGFHGHLVLLTLQTFVVALLSFNTDPSVAMVHACSVPYLAVTLLFVHGLRVNIRNGTEGGTTIWKGLWTYLTSIVKRYSPAASGAFIAGAVYGYTLLYAYSDCFGTWDGCVANPYFFPSIVIGTFVTLALLVLTYLVLKRYLATGKGLSAISAIVVLELWWAVPRGYDIGAVYLKLAPLLAGLMFVVGLVYGRRAVASALAVIFIASALWVDTRAHKGFPDRYDPFTEAPYVEFLRENAGYGRVIGAYGILYPNFAGAIGLYDIRYINALSPKNFQHYMMNHLHSEQVASETSSSLWFTGGGEQYFVDRDAGGSELRRRPVEEDILSKLRGYSFLGVRYIVTPPDTMDTLAGNVGEEHSGGPLKRVYSGEVDIFENTLSQPRAFMVHETVTAGDYIDAQATFMSPGFDPRSTAVIEREVPGWSGGAPGKKGSSASISSYSAGRVVIEVKAKASGFLVLTDTHYPGWKARDNGMPTEVYRINGLVRGVYLTAGEHIVEFTYLPASFIVGAALSGLGLLFLIVLLTTRSSKDANGRAS